MVGFSQGTRLLRTLTLLTLLPGTGHLWRRRAVLLRAFAEYNTRFVSVLQGVAEIVYTVGARMEGGINGERQMLLMRGFVQRIAHSTPDALHKTPHQKLLSFAVDAALHPRPNCTLFLLPPVGIRV